METARFALVENQGGQISPRIVVVIVKQIVPMIAAQTASNPHTIAAADIKIQVAALKSAAQRHHPRAKHHSNGATNIAFNSQAVGHIRSV